MCSVSNNEHTSTHVRAAETVAFSHLFASSLAIFLLFVSAAMSSAGQGHLLRQRASGGARQSLHLPQASAADAQGDDGKHKESVARWQASLFPIMFLFEFAHCSHKRSIATFRLNLPFPFFQSLDHERPLQRQPGEQEETEVLKTKAPPEIFCLHRFFF